MADPVMDGAFGRSVAITGDVALVGATNSPVTVFKQNQAGVWTQERLINAADITSTVDWCFGCTVALSPQTSAIGAHLDYELGTNAGAVYLYRNTMVLFADSFESGDTTQWSVTVS